MTAQTAVPPATSTPAAASWLAPTAVGVTLLLWASAFVAIRHLAGTFSPGALSLGRLLVGTLCLGAVASRRGLTRPTRGQWVSLLTIGVLWFGVYNVALNAGEHHLDAGSSVMLIQVSPVLVALLATTFLRERFTVYLAVGLALAFGGVALIATASSDSRGRSVLGVVLCLVAAVVYSISLVLQKPLVARLPAVQVTWLACTTGAVVCLPFAGQLVSDTRSASAADIWWVVYLGVFPTAIAFTTFAYALRSMSASSLGVTTYLVPPITIVMGWLFLDEVPPGLAYVGGALALVGVAVARRKPRTLATRAPGAELAPIVPVLIHRRAAALLGAAALASTALMVTAPPAADAAAYTPVGPGFTIPDATPTGASSSINASGEGGLVTDVNVTINVTHTFPADLDVELVGPNQQAVMLMSDDCNGGDLTGDLLTFDDSAAAPLGTTDGSCPSGVYQPSNNGPGDAMPVPITATTLSAFNGINGNGPWTLVAVDDNAVDTGSIGGWQLNIQTGPFTVQLPGPGSGDVGPGSPYPLSIPVQGQPGLVTDLNVTLPGVTHRDVDDLDILLVGPNGARVMLASDACGDVAETNVSWTFDDQAAAPLPPGPPAPTSSAAACGTGVYRPGNTGTADAMPEPAPAEPYGTALSAFNGISPDGIWQLFVQDDVSGGDGFLVGQPQLSFTLTDLTPPQTKIDHEPRTGSHTKARISFSSSEPQSTFQCKVDSAKKFRACRSPLVLKHLNVGRHKVQVRAVDPSGNVDASPARATWFVVRPRAAARITA